MREKLQTNPRTDFVTRNSGVKLHTAAPGYPLAWSTKMIALISSGMICAGCAVGPDFKTPQAPAAEQYTRSKISVSAEGVETQNLQIGEAVRQDWWRAFSSPTLNRLIEQAFTHNPGITNAEAALRQAQENLAAQRAAYFPVVQTNYSASRQQNASGTISPTLTSGVPLYTLHSAQLTISYAPDVFGLNRRTMESLEAQRDNQDYQLRAAYLTLASNVVAAAIQIANLQAQIHATQDIVVSAKRALTMLQKQSDLGFASGLDVAAQEAALAQSQLALPPLLKQLEQARDLLAILTGRLPSEAEEYEFDLDTLHLPQSLPLSLPSDLVAQRPDIRAAEAQLHAASAQVGIAIASRLPQFSLSGNYGGNSVDFSHMFSAGNKFWGLTGSISQTLFDFGALKHKQGAAEAGLDQAAAQYRSVVLTAFQNVADTLYALDADAKTLALANKAEQTAQKTMALTKQQMEAGYVGALPLLSAEQAYQQAKIGRIQALAARYTDTAALFQALGGGWKDNLETGRAPIQNVIK